MAQSIMNDHAAKSLGSQNSYAVYTDTFDPSQLNPMPRVLARQDWGIKGDEFVGFDTWHCHEATFLLNNGVPVAGTLKVICPASSEFMVESKSFKLYLNTFDMCKMGDTLEEAIDNYEKQVQIDVSKAIGTEVKVGFFQSGHDKIFKADPGKNYNDLHWEIGRKELEATQITDYSSKEKYNIIVEEGSGPGTFMYFTNVLRSRCRHTKQKDTGAAYFIIETKRGIVNKLELLKLVISLREVNEFHEFCAEKLFTEIMANPNVENCSVMLLYARRGSLDICPVRASNSELLNEALNDETSYSAKAMGQ